MRIYMLSLLELEREWTQLVLDGSAMAMTAHCFLHWGGILGIDHVQNMVSNGYISS